MENNKKRIYAVIAIGVLLLLLIGSTFAYFAAQGTDASQTDVNVLTHTVDSLVFETGDALSITADQNTFAQGKGNQTDSTFARATLKANSSTNTATDHYYVYLSIDENTFEYTTEAKTAELILTINKVEGETKTPLTSIDGLNYVTVGSVSGFDITEYDDLITIANNYEITSNGTKVDEWEVTLTLVNLDSNQNNNTGKVFNGLLLIQKSPLLSQYIKSLYTTQGVNNLYHHDSTLAKGAQDDSYRYAGGDYRVADAYKTQYAKINDIIKFEVDSNITSNPNEYYRYYLTYDLSKTYYDNPKKVLDKAILDGYVVADSIDNYVCFGSNAEECPYGNLYRIIGVFGSSVKLIKADYATEDQLGTDGDFYSTYNSINEWNNFVYNFENLDDIANRTKNSKYTTYGWNKTNYNLSNNEVSKLNVWSYSELNKTNLNKNYLNSLETEWSNKIKESLWYVGGMSNAVGINSNAKTVYEYELGSNKNIIAPFEPYKAKVGLMYLSEYYYGTLPDYWTLPGYGDDSYYIDDNGFFEVGTDYSMANADNWILLGEFEWTISRSDTDSVFFLTSNGGVASNIDVNNEYTLVRPVFYLNFNVTLDGGSGTETDPYRIA